MTTNADEWVEQKHFVYTNALLTAIRATTLPRKVFESEFFNDLHRFYSLQILHNARFLTERSLVASTLQKNPVWEELRGKRENLEISSSAISVSPKNFTQRIFKFSEKLPIGSFDLLWRFGRKILSALDVKITCLDFRRKYVGSLQSKIPDYRIQIAGYVFNKIEVVALVEIAIFLKEYILARAVLEKTKVMFSVEPDKIWFDQIQIRCSFLELEGTNVVQHEESLYYAYTLKDFVVNSSDVIFNTSSYIVNEDIVLSFQNRVGHFEFQLNTEKDCLLVNQLSFVSKLDSTLLSQGEFVSLSNFFIGPTGRNIIGLSVGGLVAVKKQRSEKFLSEKTPFLLSSASSSNYWHVMVEVLPRLIHLSEGQTIIWVGEISDRYKEIIQMLRPNTEFLNYPSSGVTLANIMMSPLSTISSEPFWEAKIPRFDKETLLTFRSELLSAFEMTQDWKEGIESERVFLIRKSSHRSREMDGFAILLKEFGFLVVDPSGMTIAQQAKLFSCAKVLVGEVGAVWANMLFCTAGTKIFSLCAESSAPAPLFSGFAQILGLEFLPIALPDAWQFDPKTHWRNTPEAYYQSGFEMTKNLEMRALEYILKNLVTK